MTPWEILQAIFKARTREGDVLDAEDPNWKDRYIQENSELQSYSALLQAVNEQTEYELQEETAKANELGVVGGMAQAFGHGASLGLAPHIGKAIAQIPGGMSPEEYEETYSGQRAGFREEHPILATGAEIAGGAAMGIAAPGAVLSGAGRAAQVAGRGSQFARAAEAGRAAVARPVGMLATGMAGGAGEGAIQGAAEAAPGERWAGARRGAELGAIFGLGGAGLVSGLGAGFRRFVAPTGEEAVEKGMRNVAGGERVPTQQVPETLQTRLDAIPESERGATALADLDEGLMSRLQSEAQEETGAAAARKLRGGLTPEVDIDAMRTATGMTQQQVTQMTSSLETARRIAGEGFQGVGDVPVTQGLLDAFEMPGVQRAYQSLQRQAAQAGQELPDLVEGGWVPFSAMDRLRRILRDRVDAAFTPGQKGKIDPEPLRRMRDTFTNAFDNAFDNAPNVRGDYRDAIRTQEAFEIGERALKEPSRIVEDQIARLTDVERTAYQAGLIQTILDQVEDTVNPVNFFRKPKVRSIIETVLGENRLQKVKDAADRVVTRRARRVITEGSQTGARQAGITRPTLSSLTVGLPEQLMRGSRARRATEILARPGAAQEGIDIMRQRLGTQFPQGRGNMLGLNLGPEARAAGEGLFKKSQLTDALRAGMREGTMLAPYAAAPAGLRLMEKWRPERERDER